MDRNTRAGYFFSHGTPDEFVRMSKIPKRMWVDLYVDLYWDSHPDARLDTITNDARSRQVKLGRLGIR